MSDGRIEACYNSTTIHFQEFCSLVLFQVSYLEKGQKSWILLLAISYSFLSHLEKIDEFGINFREIVALPKRHEKIDYFPYAILTCSKTTVPKSVSADHNSIAQESDSIKAA